MKKKLIAICLSALILTSVTSVNCMAKNPYPDEESYSESSFAILQDILRENDCQTGIAFLGYIGYDATTEEILDYTHPKVFEIADRETMLKILDETFQNDQLRIRLVHPKT